MGDGWITQLRKGVLEYCVLLVVKGGASYGYEIVQALKKMSDLEVGESTVYPILSRLAEEGCLARRREASPNGPPRTYLSLTVAGELRMEAMGSYWRRLEKVMHELEGRTSSTGND